MAGRRRLMFAKNFAVNYLRFTALESGTFTLTIGTYVSTGNISYVEYSVDEGETWVKTDNYASTPISITTPTINVGDSVLWRGSGVRTSQTGVSVGSTTNYSRFRSTCQCTVSGDIRTLLGLDNPKNVTMNTYMFFGLFDGMSTLKDASDLNLPSTLSNYCFTSMFYNCNSLVNAPELPATTLAQYCYSRMFYGCSSLINAPELPAPSLNSNCYYEMFVNCTSLIYIKTDYSTWDSSSYYSSSKYNWTNGVTTVGTYIKNPSATSSVVSSATLLNLDNVPYTWTVVTGFTVTSWSSPSLNTTPVCWIYLPIYNEKTLHLIIGDVEYVGNVSYASNVYTYSGSSQNGNTFTIKFTISRDRSGNPSSITMQYNPNNLTDYPTGTYTCSYYGTDE